MKIIKNALILVFVIFISSTLFSQSSSVREIKVEDDDSSIYLKYEDEELTKFELDGKTIAPHDYKKYKTIIERYKKQSAPTPPKPPRKSEVKVEDENDIYNEELIAFLEESGHPITTSKYKIKLTTECLKINGKTVSKQKLQKALAIFEKVFGYELPEEAEYKVKIKPNSRSITLSIN